MNELYPIGDVARRTGLNVSAIRFYADEGIVPPSGLTEGGFRLYDVTAIARLELVRTLRDLGVGLDEIRRVLAGEAGLHDVAVAHLRLVEDSLRQFRARRAVLRTMVRQPTTAEQVSLMHRLVAMSDEDRDRMISEFWDFVTEGLVVHPSYIERLHSARPHLPEDPSTEQLEAWIKLAEIVRDEEIRKALREFYRRAFGNERGRLMASPEMTAHAERQQALMVEAMAVYESGVPAESPHARDIAERVAAARAEMLKAMTGRHDVERVRRGMAEFDPNLEHAIRTGVKYQNLSGAMLVWSAAPEEDGFVLRADLPDPALDPAVAIFLIQEAFASVLRLTRLTVGEAFAPRRVEFTFEAPSDAGAFGELFRCPVSFGAGRNRFVLSPASAATAMPGRDPVTFASILELLDGQLAARRDQQELLEVLEISIAQSLPAVPSFAEQARRHSASERTLRRRLAECGTTYEAVVDGVRRERVEQLLRRPEPTFREIAHRAGFSDERALRRAVRRWHGTAPLELRKRFLQPDERPGLSENPSSAGARPGSGR